MADPKTTNKAKPATAAPAAEAPASPAPTQTGSVTYSPGPGDPPVTVAFGKTFRAGKATQIDDPAIYKKLAGHPQFARKGKEADDGDAEELRKASDEAAEEARKAREEADAIGSDAEAKERAARALSELQSAANDSDRDPVTNHPVNR